MTRTTYIKINSHTQQQAMKAKGTLHNILESSGCTKDEWTAILFEIGCRFAEIEFEDAFDRITNPKRGFWGWWLQTWLEDDQTLLESGLDLSNYQQIKEELFL